MKGMKFILLNPQRFGLGRKIVLSTFAAMVFAGKLEEVCISSSIGATILINCSADISLQVQTYISGRVAPSEQSRSVTTMFWVMRDLESWLGLAKMLAIFA